MSELSELNSSIEFWVVGIMITVVSVAGILGNIICILMFQYQTLNMTQTFASLLKWLAVIDSLFLVFCLMVFSLPVISQHYKIWIFPYVLPSLLPCTSIALTGSLYCVIALSFERYFSISNSGQQNKGSFFGYILPVIVFSTCFNFPKFFEFSTNFSFSDKKQYYVPFVKATVFRDSPDYSFYVLGSSFIFLGVVPFSLLLILNCISAGRLRTSFYSTHKPEVSMSLLLYGIVIVQLVSHIPRTALNIYEIYSTFTSSPISLSYSWLVDLSHLLLAVSSASNVLIYTVQDLRFRSLLLEQLNNSLRLYKHSSKGQFEPVDECDRTVEAGKTLNSDETLQHEFTDIPRTQVFVTSATCEYLSCDTKLMTGANECDRIS